MKGLRNVAGKILFTLCLLNSYMAVAVDTATIKKETPEYLLDIKYPQGFASKEINTSVQDFIKNSKKRFLAELIEDAGTPADAPGKTGLTITYSIPFNAKNSLSIRFNSSIYHRGAAHPSNSVFVLNFAQGHPVKLSDLFIAKADYLKTIADYCKKAITAKDISEAQWIKEGTDPTEEHYNTWYFTKKGIAIVFNTYQVAAYVYGEQTVTVPLSLISPMIKPEISKMMWGN